MSKGALDTAAHEAGKRAEVDAAKRGLRVVAMSSYHGTEGRGFRFQLEPIASRRKAEAEPPPSTNRGMAAQATLL